MNVAVVGGGVIGLSIAFECLRAGLTPTVVRPEQGASRASWTAAGMLAPVSEAAFGEDAVLNFNLTSHGIYQDWVQGLERASGESTGLRQCGTLIVCRDADDAAATARLFEFMRGHLLDVEQVDSREARRIEPALAPRLRGALWAKNDHHVNPRQLLVALDAATRSGGGHVIGEKATEVTSTSVTTADGNQRQFDAVVVAAGSDSGRLLETSGFELPIEPVKGQAVRLRRDSGAICPSTVVRGLEAYVVPHGEGEIVVGASSEDRGWDTRPTAGVIRELLERAAELVPGLDECEVAELSVALRPATADRRPVIGQIGGGPIVATGHFRHGVLMAPATAKAVVELLTKGSATDLPAAFSPDRFAKVAA